MVTDMKRYELTFGITHLDNMDNILRYPSVVFETKLRVMAQKEVFKKIGNS